MEEIEVDILEIDVEEITSKLKSLGAKKSFEGRIDSLYFDFNNKSLDKNHELLRLRKKGHECTLTLKKKTKVKNDSMEDCEEEYDVTIENFEKARLLLEQLGLIECQTDSRDRICYKLKNSAVNINIYDNSLPW